MHSFGEVLLQDASLCAGIACWCFCAKVVGACLVEGRIWGSVLVGWVGVIGTVLEEQGTGGEEMCERIGFSVLSFTGEAPIV